MRERRGRPDQRGLKAPQGHQARRVRQGLRERLGSRERPEHPVLTGNQDNPALTERPVRLAATVLPALWDLQALRDRPALRVPQGRLVQLVRTAPTVAAS